eukprot:COSAG03_NODE_2666_length_2542_cov_3.426525_2_plen_106_part_00
MMPEIFSCENHEALVFFFLAYDLVLGVATFGMPDSTGSLTVAYALTSCRFPAMFALSTLAYIWVGPGDRWSKIRDDGPSLMGLAGCVLIFCIVSHVIRESVARVS